MPTTAQMLADLPEVLLEVIAELRNADLLAEGSRTTIVARLAEELTNPTSVQFAWQEAVDTDARSEAALEMLAAAGGELPETQFTREFGSIRQMGPGKLQRETPWLFPEGVAEVLHYLGLLGLGFTGVGKDAKSIVYVPSDALPWLPRPSMPLAEGALAIQPAAPPPRSRTILCDDSFLEDAGTLIGFLYSDQLHITGSGPNAEDIDRLVQRLQYPFDDSTPDQSVRLALMLHLANRLGWLRRGEKGLVQLTGNRVREFLDQTRAEQRYALFEAWRASTEWNDLRRTPGLALGENVSLDPSRVRANLLDLLGKVQPGAWYRTSDLVAAIKKSQPEFLRPTSLFDQWEVYTNNTQESLAGFEHWEQVEGALIAFALKGMLHWLGAVDLAEPSAGDDWLISLTNWGARWLGMDVVQPTESGHRAMQVQDTYVISLPLGTPLGDRFRVERFAQWQASYPNHQFQISQRSLKHAEENGIGAEQIIKFLQSRTTKIPDNVMSALRRMNKEKVHT